MKMETQHIKTYRGYTKSSSRKEFIEINVYIKKQAISAAQNSTFKKKYHGIRSLHFMANRWGKSGNRDRFSWAPKSLQTVTAAMKLRCLLFGRKAVTNPDSI